MSTKQSIKYGERFHLYQDVMDNLGEVGADTRPVYLELTDARFECAAAHDFSHVTIAIPHDVAVEIGLLAPKAGASNEG